MKVSGSEFCWHFPLFQSGEKRINLHIFALLAAAGFYILVSVSLSPAQRLKTASTIFDTSSRSLSLDFNTSIIDQIVHTRIKHGIVPEALLKFDWLIYPTAQFKLIKRKPVPKYVFCEAKHGISVLSAELRQLNADYLGDVLLVGGVDTHLSVLEQNIDWRYLLLKFKRVRYEAKDIASDVVETFPMGLLPHYSLAAGEDNIRKTVREASVIKKNLALAAWGKWWPRLTDKIPSRKGLANFANKTDWVSLKDIEKDKWWQTLSTYKFMFCPTGAGIQSPKWVEAILCLTVPIVQNETTYFDLYQQGFPLIVVDKWEDLEPRKLEEAWERLLPSLLKTRSLFQTDNWFRYVISDDLKLNLK